MQGPAALSPETKRGRGRPRKDSNLSTRSGASAADSDTVTSSGHKRARRPVIPDSPSNDLSSATFEHFERTEDQVQQSSQDHDVLHMDLPEATFDALLDAGEPSADEAEQQSDLSPPSDPSDNESSDAYPSPTQPVSKELAALRESAKNIRAPTGSPSRSRRERSTASASTDVVKRRSRAKGRSTASRSHKRKSALRSMQRSESPAEHDSVDVQAEELPPEPARSSPAATEPDTSSDAEQSPRAKGKRKANPTITVEDMDMDNTDLDSQPEHPAKRRRRLSTASIQSSNSRRADSIDPIEPIRSARVVNDRSSSLGITNGAKSSRKRRNRSKLAQEEDANSTEDDGVPMSRLPVSIDDIAKRAKLNAFKEANDVVREKAHNTIEYERELISAGTHPIVIRLLALLEVERDVRRKQALQWRDARLQDIARVSAADERDVWTEWQEAKREARHHMASKLEGGMRKAFYEFWQDARVSTLQRPPEPLPFMSRLAPVLMEEETVPVRIARKTREKEEVWTLSQTEIDKDLKIIGLRITSKSPAVTGSPCHTGSKLGVAARHRHTASDSSKATGRLQAEIISAPVLPVAIPQKQDLMLSAQARRQVSGAPLKITSYHSGQTGKEIVDLTGPDTPSSTPVVPSQHQYSDYSRPSELIKVPQALPMYNGYQANNDRTIQPLPSHRQSDGSAKDSKKSASWNAQSSSTVDAILQAQQARRRVAEVAVHDPFNRHSIQAGSRSASKPHKAASGPAAFFPDFKPAGSAHSDMADYNQQQAHRSKSDNLFPLPSFRQAGHPDLMHGHPSQYDQTKLQLSNKAVYPQQPHSLSLQDQRTTLPAIRPRQKQESSY